MQIRCSYDELVPIEKLKAHPKNPNKHSQQQIENFAQILRYQGVRRPIRVSTLSGYVTAGHGLIEALRTLGEQQGPVNYQEYENEEQEYADIVADNAVASQSRLDFKAINLEIPNLSPTFDISLFGLKNFKIDAAEHEKEKCSSCGQWIKKPYNGF